MIRLPTLKTLDYAHEIPPGQVLAEGGIAWVLQKGFALAAQTRHIKRMSSTVLEAKKLRPEIIQRIENLDDENLLVLHRFLLIVEKERLWRELSTEAEQDRASGQLQRLPEIIREARAELREG